MSDEIAQGTIEAELKQQIVDLQAQVDNLQPTKKEIKPLSAPYEVKALGQDRIGIKIDGRPNVAQFAWLKMFCFNLIEIKAERIEYIDENRNYINVTNPTDEEIDKFKSSKGNKHASGVDILQIHDIQIDMKVIYPEDLSITKKEYLNNFVIELSAWMDK